MIEREVAGITVKFDEKQHKYFVKDREIPSVTTITGMIHKPALMYWSANCAGDYVEDKLAPGKALDEVQINELAEGARKAHTHQGSKATTIGSIVHDFAEDYMTARKLAMEEPPMPVNEKAQKSVNQFLDWVSEIDIKPYETEQICFHTSHDYAGTYDLLAEIDGKLTVIDYKTSKAIYDEYWMQVAAYLFASRHLRKLEDKELPTQAGIIRFPKDGAGFEVEIKSSEALWDHFWAGFLSARSLLHWEQEIV